MNLVSDLHLAQIDFFKSPENLTSKGELEWGHLEPYPGMSHLKDPKSRTAEATNLY